jgi:hypothetical protein
MVLPGNRDVVFTKGRPSTAIADEIVCTVKMHWVRIGRDVQNPPPNRIAHAVGEAFGIRPRPTVDNKKKILTLSALKLASERIGHHPDHQYAVLRQSSEWRARGVYHYGAGELCIFVKPIS